MIWEFIISGLYLFVGLLIGYIAKSSGLRYALIPALLIRPLQILLLWPSFSHTLIGFWLPLSIVTTALLFSLLGGVAGVRLKELSVDKG